MIRREVILAADIGGTNTRFLAHEIKICPETIIALSCVETLKVGDEQLGHLIMNKKYENQDFKSFSEILRQFLVDAHLFKPPIAACLAVAGPVDNNVVRFTNRGSWTIDGDQIAQEFGIKVVELVNDFVAAGYGVLTLDEAAECVKLQDAPKVLDAPIACIGAGTGLGECFLTPGTDGSYQCYPTEGGHSEFAPRDDVELGMFRFLRDKFGEKHRISVERIVSGTGLPNIYEYLASVNPEVVNPVIHKEIEEAGDLKGAVIAMRRKDNALCKKAMEIFVRAYGAEAGVVGLKYLPFGGLYIMGGLTPKNMDLINVKDGPFLHALLDKGRVSGMLCGIPIFAVKVENLGERGALLNAFKLLQKELKDSDLINEYAPSITERMRSGSMASFGRGRAGSTASLMRSRASSLFSLANQRARGMSNADTFGVNANINAPASKAPKSDGFVYSVQHVEPPIYEDSKEDSNSEDSEDNKMEFDFNTPLQLLSVSLLTSCTILFSLVLMKKTSII